MGMKWLITGGCGFIGTRLIKNLVREGEHSIRLVDNLSVGTRDNLASVCDFVELDYSTLSSARFAPNHSPQLIVGDILNEKLAIQAAQGVDVIVHLAANTGVSPSVEDPRMDCAANVIGTLNYLEAARLSKVKRFVFASSGAPVGECEPPVHEEMVPHPVSPYGASKLAGEGYCSAYFHTFGVETVVLRFGNVYGPGSDRKNSVVSKFIKRAMKGKTLEIYGDGSQTRDFIYIDDLVKALRLAGDRNDVGGEVFQIATNKETSVNELVDNLSHVLREAGYGNIKVKNSTERLGDVKRNYSDTTKAKKLLGWTAEISLTSGLALTVQ